MRQVCTNRPEFASVEALKACISWLDECKRLGWKEDSMPSLEQLWWGYHDKEGKSKRPILAEINPLPERTLSPVGDSSTRH